MPRSPLTLLLGAGFAAVVLGAGLWVTRPQGPDLTPEQAANRALVGGPFTLVRNDGKPVTQAILNGQPSLVYFGYTWCPDVCPTELQTMAQAIDLFEKAHPDKAGLVLPVFISVDPQRDTPAVLRDYVKAFHPRLVGLTGTTAQVEAAKRAYKVYSARRPGAARDEYLVDHSSMIFLMDRTGSYVAHFGGGADPQAIAARLADVAG